MSGKRVKALRREFVKTHMIGVDGRLTFKNGKRIYWEQMTVTRNDEFRAFRKAYRRSA